MISEDEVGELASAFNKMIADLKTTLVSRDALAEQIRHRELLSETIRGVVFQLGATSTDILSASGRLSLGAREQAAAVKATVSTVDEVSRTAVQAASRARKVAESVRRKRNPPVARGHHKVLGQAV